MTPTSPGPSDSAIARDDTSGPTDDKRGDSRIQREAERTMVAWLSEQLGVTLEPERVKLSGGSHVRIDGTCSDPRMLCEAWAHQGRPRGAQHFKLMNDAMKMVAAARVLGDGTRMFLLFADEAAARPFRSGTWRAEALEDVGIEIKVAELDEVLRSRIRAAQTAQFR